MAEQKRAESRQMLESLVLSGRAYFPTGLSKGESTYPMIFREPVLIVGGCKPPVQARASCFQALMSSSAMSAPHLHHIDNDNAR
jgi:hypothetical protein